ncbi:hypothetical protein Kpol_460p24 [Vanderwaltozyma polyspora DSM 70294]|uniref:Spindle pole body component SPC42 n=1 Tax=Vanderwaltozyma polyspora (strain ATCC 22028 / DSM 70294 / BCRC 21397 / CBS 2163 / NBRC 10782 / NRRL Y-8283 / UCD 57-17) TaxID=436907 RepID=SPC42_VANPO|nr:uncharacterized protein Kpol_460p24 [Vanderwaltozyma polyspora DSM 70294]A7TQU0.1 RecName: Full=Spindle pole body component SPC42 [Vanderwaltozyma polyspora DSM 70294]EDO15389.1 hypothetical protein Kpol_460p24 [Vanderwaltozyma polyspora DSM 70294]
MNISPTPKRYSSARSNRNENNIPSMYSDPLYNDNMNQGGGIGHLGGPRNIGNVPTEKIVPEEYRLNSQMINRLIKQNKELNNKLNSKQDEINRLNSLVGSLRAKLIKYTELNKKLNSDLQNFQNSEIINNSITEDVNDYIQVPKKRSVTLGTSPDSMSTPTILKNSHPVDEKINKLNDKLDKLTNLVLEEKSSQSTTSNKSTTPPVTSQPNLFFSKGPSDEDIMVKESVELKNLEDQIDSLKRKLLIKRENELRKISLNQELLELMDKLNLQNPSNAQQNFNNFDISPPLSRSNNESPEYCLECHNRHTSHSQSHNNHNISNKQQNSQYHHQHQKESYLKKPDLPISNPLDTPTPLNKRPT